MTPLAQSAGRAGRGRYIITLPHPFTKGHVDSQAAALFLPI